MQKILDSIHQERMNFKESFLDPTDKRSILVRMLNNLRGIYLNNVDLGKLLKVLDCIITLIPNSAPETRERGMVNYHLCNYEAAVEDLSRYLELSPNSSDTQEIQGNIKQIRSFIEKLRQCRGWLITTLDMLWIVTRGQNIRSQVFVFLSTIWTGTISLDPSRSTPNYRRHRSLVPQDESISPLYSSAMSVQFFHVLLHNFLSGFWVLLIKPPPASWTKCYLTPVGHLLSS